MALGSISKVEIAADGWSAYVTLEGMGQDTAAVSYDLSPTTLPGLTFTVTSPGFDASGNPVSVTREVIASRVVREAYPTQTYLDHKAVDGNLVVRVALSEYMYSGETFNVTARPGWAVANLTGGAISSTADAAAAVELNGSALTFASVKPIAQFVTPDHQVVGTTLHVEVTAASAFAAIDQEVRAVKYIVSDQHGHQTTTVVNADSVSSWGVGDAKPVTSFGADINTAIFTEGDLLTVHAQVLPFAGEMVESVAASTAIANPMAFADQVYVLDKDGNFGKSYAYVNASVAAGSGAVNLDPALAALTPFRTIAAAMTAMATYNQANLGRSTLDNSEIRLTAGIHKWIDGFVDKNTVKTDAAWLTITRDPSVSKADVKIIGATDGLHSRAFLDYVKIQDVTIDRTPMGTSNALIVQGELGDRLWLDNIVFNGAENTFGSFVVREVWVTQSDFNNVGRGLYSFGGDPNIFKIRGVDAEAVSQNLISGQLLVGSDLFNMNLPNFFGGANPTPNGSLIAYNNFVDPDNATFIELAKNMDTHGFAVLGNQFSTLFNVQPGISLSADGHFRSNSNIIFHGNLVTGSRVNIGYNDQSGQNFLKTEYSVKWNNLFQINTKHDVFASDGANTGAWSILYGVGFANNNTQVVAAAPTFKFEYDGPGSNVTGGINNYVQSGSMYASDPPSNLVFNQVPVIENVALAAGAVVATISYTDDAIGTETITLSGADASLFVVVGNEVRWNEATTPNFEVKSSYSFTISVDDPAFGNLVEIIKPVVINVTNVNEAPTNLTATVPVPTLPSGTPIAAGTNVATFAYQDDALGTETITLSGPDAALFSLVGSAVVWAGAVTPNSATKPNYTFTINIDDPTLGSGAELTQVITLNVSGGNAAPTNLVATATPAAVTRECCHRRRGRGGDLQLC